MALAANCPGCGRPLKVPENAGGRSARCGACGTTFVLPGKKLCSRCGKDLTTLRRMKDARGDYYCDDCGKPLVARTAQARGAPVAPAALQAAPGSPTAGEGRIPTAAPEPAQAVPPATKPDAVVEAAPAVATPTAMEGGVPRAAAHASRRRAGAGPQPARMSPTKRAFIMAALLSTCLVMACQLFVLFSLLNQDDQGLLRLAQAVAKAERDATVQSPFRASDAQIDSAVVERWPSIQRQVRQALQGEAWKLLLGRIVAIALLATMATAVLKDWRKVGRGLGGCLSVLLVLAVLYCWCTFSRSLRVYRYLEGSGMMYLLDLLQPFCLTAAAVGCIMATAAIRPLAPEGSAGAARSAAGRSSLPYLLLWGFVVLGFLLGFILLCTIFAAHGSDRTAGLVMGPLLLAGSGLMLWGVLNLKQPRSRAHLAGLAGSVLMGWMVVFLPVLFYYIERRNRLKEEEETARDRPV